VSGNWSESGNRRLRSIARHRHNGDAAFAWRLLRLFISYLSILGFANVRIYVILAYTKILFIAYCI